MVPHPDQWKQTQRKECGKLKSENSFKVFKKILDYMILQTTGPDIGVQEDDWVVNTPQTPREIPQYLSFEKNMLTGPTPKIKYFMESFLTWKFSFELLT